MEELNRNEEPHVLPPKRKQTTQDEGPTKKLRPDESAVEDKVTNDNGGKDEIKDEIRDEIEDEEEEDEEEEEEDYEGEDEIDDEDEDDDNDERFNGGGEVDRKGKGVMKDDKGKGKMIEESEEEDDDDSDEVDGESESDGDDDLSDDPLTEVDLDNILPSRTRRRTAPAGVRISGDEIGKDGDA